jgi:hypothetical protein
MERKQELTTKIYPSLPLVVGKVVVLGGRQNSVCGLSFSRSLGRAIAVQLGKNRDVAKESKVRMMKKTIEFVEN